MKLNAFPYRNLGFGGEDCERYHSSRRSSAHSCEHIARIWAILFQIRIDYRCEDGRFSMSASCVAISSPNSLISSSETGGYSWNKKLKRHFSNWAWCPRAIGGVYFSQRSDWLKLYNPFWNSIIIFKPRLESVILNCIPVAERFVFLNFILFIFILHIYSFFKYW